MGLSDQIDDLRSEIQARIQMGRALAAMGESQKARLDSSTLITTAERLRDWLSLRDTAWRKAEDCFLRGEWEDARAYVGSVPENLALLTTLAMVEYETGEYVSGSAIMDRIEERRGRAGGAQVQVGEGFT